MPFTGIGFGEMLVITLLILIVFGPKRLPEITRSMGKAIREFKRGMNEIQRELDVADREARWNQRQKGSGAPATASRAGAPRTESQPTIAAPAPDSEELSASASEEPAPSESDEAEASDGPAQGRAASSPSSR